MARLTNETTSRPHSDRRGTPGRPRPVVARGLITCLLLTIGPLVTACANAKLSTEPSVEVRGRLVSTTGAPITCPTPYVVMLRSRTPRAKTSIPRTTLTRGRDGFASRFAVVGTDGYLLVENQDRVCHEFFSTSYPNAFNLGLLNPGESKTCRFKHPGEVKIYCSLHSGEHATIMVTTAPRYAMVDENGEFRIPDLRPGLYVLKTWSRSSASQIMDLSVLPRDPTIVELQCPDLEPAR